MIIKLSLVFCRISCCINFTCVMNRSRKWNEVYGIYPVLRSISMLFLLWFSITVCEGCLWERLRIYSGKLFIAKKIGGYVVLTIKVCF